MSHPLPTDSLGRGYRKGFDPRNGGSQLQKMWKMMLRYATDFCCVAKHGEWLVKSRWFFGFDLEECLVSKVPDVSTMGIWMDLPGFPVAMVESCEKHRSLCLKNAGRCHSPGKSWSLSSAEFTNWTPHKKAILGHSWWLNPMKSTILIHFFAEIPIAKSCLKTTRGYGHLPLRIGLWRPPEPWVYETSRGAHGGGFHGDFHGDFRGNNP